MSESTHEALRAHMAKWRSEGQPGFNTNPLDGYREEVRWLCQRLERLEKRATAFEIREERR